MTTTRTFSSRASEWQIKEQMCEIGRRIWQRSFCAGNEGNHSFRLNDNRVLCTPTGISKGELRPEDICTVDMNGDQVAGNKKRTSEIQLHLAIYNARPDVRAVVHSHPPHATAFAVAGVDLPTCIHPEAEVFLGAVKSAPYVTPGDARLGESILPYVKDSNTILLQSHGVVTYGEDLRRAYYQLEIVDAYARILILAKQVGSIRPLEPTEMKELLVLKERFGMTDSRDTDKLSCAADFVQRVNADPGTRGRMVSDGGVAPVSHASASSPMENAIGLMLPASYSEADVDRLVQSITDQIMDGAV